ncbi:MAG: hypothetical protein ACLFQX_07035 [Candidatus Kapaibacterium sp.]
MEEPNIRTLQDDFLKHLFSMLRSIEQKDITAIANTLAGLEEMLGSFNRNYRRRLRREDYKIKCAMQSFVDDLRQIALTEKNLFLIAVKLNNLLVDWWSLRLCREIERMTSREKRRLSWESSAFVKN